MPLDPRTADYLAAVDGVSRRFDFRFDGLVLRKGRSRKARASQRRRREEIRGEIADEMNRRRRRAFRGPVAVELDLFGCSPQAPTAVKAYLDCLEGLVYPDDRAVQHLVVSRFPPRGETPNEPRVYLRIVPLRCYIASFDYVFNLGERLDERRECFWREDAAPWARAFDDHDHDELRRLQREADDDWAWEEDEDEDRWIDLEAQETRGWIRDWRREQIRSLRIKQFLDQPLDYLDRPGPPPAWVKPLLESDPDREVPDIGIELVEPQDNLELPGNFWLTGPTHNWQEVVRRELVATRRRWGLWDAPIDRPIALDIAVQGLEPPGKDLDNLAHAIVVPFEEVYCDGDRGTVGTYRVYQRQGKAAGVRVKVLERERVRAAHSLIDDAHHGRLTPVLDY